MTSGELRHLSLIAAAVICLIHPHMRLESKKKLVKRFEENFQMVGKRVYPDENGLVPWEAGSYWKAKDGVWWAYPPKGSGGALINHTVTEHEDGTITVFPSILNNKWHGFLEHGIWRGE